jgi:hypothetical protein
MPLVYVTRQDNFGSVSDGYDDDRDDQIASVHCEGRGVMLDGSVCEVRDGRGLVDAGADGDESEGRRDFSAAEQERFGRTGKAIWPDDHWAFPTPTKADWNNAVRSLGRTQAGNRAKVKAHLSRRAKQEGRALPESWRAARDAHDWTG